MRDPKPDSFAGLEAKWRKLIDEGMPTDRIIGIEDVLKDLESGPEQRVREIVKAMRLGAGVPFLNATQLVALEIYAERLAREVLGDEQAVKGSGTGKQ